MKHLKRLLPDYPRTPHLPHNPTVALGDYVASEEDVKPLFAPSDLTVHIEEKVDGANCGMSLVEGEAVIRNRNHVLRKGYLKDTAAKRQFLPAWNWFYENRKAFENLEGYTVYGEWLLALHGIRYDLLPTLFIAYDLYDQQTGQFVATHKARTMMEDAGLVVVPLIKAGPVSGWYDLVVMCNDPSTYSSSDKKEGLYVKFSDDKHVTARFKMVRPDYVQGALWDEKVITKNKVLVSS